MCSMPPALLSTLLLVAPLLVAPLLVALLSMASLLAPTQPQFMRTIFTKVYGSGFVKLIPAIPLS